jgi:acyl-CoA thioester hydrolase
MTSEQSLTSRDFPVHWPVLTRWTDNDMFGHLNNAVYYELFDTAINGWINTTCGIDPLTVPWLGVVAESGCKYYAELNFPDPLVVGLAVTRLGNSSVTYRLALFQAEQPLAAVGHWVHVYVDRASRRPVSIPGQIRSLLESICSADAARKQDS